MTDPELSELLRAPGETLTLELKGWLDLNAFDDRAKVARTLIALRNQNGGQLVLGFDDKHLQPITDGRPPAVRSAYHPDTIQRIVSDYASPRFDTKVEFGVRDGLEYPVISVSSGVRFPVIAKRDYKGSDDKMIVRQYSAYVRSIRNTDRVQTTEPRSEQDWEDLIRRCFDNREADIGTFVRRYLPDIVTELGRAMGSPPSSRTSSPPVVALPASDTTTARHLEKVETVVDGHRTVSAKLTLTRRARSPNALLEDGENYYQQRLAYMLKEHAKAEFPNYNSWREVAVTIAGNIRDISAQGLLSDVFVRHPRYSGWPMWLDSRAVKNAPEHPYPHEKGWEALFALDTPQFTTTPLIDFWRIDPRGEFYHRRSIEEDGWPRVPKEDRGSFLDFLVSIGRVAEALGTVQSFAPALVENVDEAVLRAAFRWRGLRGRVLESRVEPARQIFTAVEAYDDEAIAEVEMPIGAPASTLGNYVGAAIQPLFQTFGFSLSQAIIDEITKKTVEKRM